jgi:hypothetical protein
MNLAKVLLGSMALAVVLAGCVGDRPQSTPDPDPVCEAAASLQASLTALRRAQPSTSVDDVAIAAAASRAAYDELKEALGNFSQERVSTLSAALRDLETAAAQLPEGTTIEDARELLAEELQAVALAWRALGSEIGCPEEVNSTADSAS